MNLSAIMKEAHRQARIMAGGSLTYRKALAWGLRQAWAFAKGAVEIEARLAAQAAAEGPAVTALHSRIMAIETQDRLTVADYRTVEELRSEIRAAA